ncbi:MAG: hypothetical protein CBD27_10880 [Rhodospirillaceae bacterium TMED167]|nr:hypothetical protein [Rhodospirillaceae bacterium]OUW24804.1 MAG: hypothetical protein CBD27_10880 [Rhodospirillaceae bacterium TMED167]
MISTSDILREATQAFGAGDHAAAVRLFKRMIAASPESAELWNNLGQAYRGAGNLASAADAFDKAAALDPTFALPLNGLGMLSRLAGNWTLAEGYYRQALDRQPIFPEVHFNLGVLSEEQGHQENARWHYENAVRQRPGYVQAKNNLAVLLMADRDYDTAEAMLRDALGRNPNSAELLTSLGSCLRNLGRLTEAEEAYLTAVRASENLFEAKWNLALVQLAKGAYQEGWSHYRYRPSANRTRHILPEETLPPALFGHRIALEGEQGVGDEIFFLRFAPALMMRGAEVSYAGDDRLSGMAARALPGLADPASPGSSSVAVSVADLPYLLASSGVPASLRLTPLEGHLAAVRQRLQGAGPPPYIGFTYRAGLRGKGALYKEAPLAELASLLRELPGTLINLQRELKSEEQRDLEAQFHGQVLGVAGDNTDLETMIAVMACLDEYIGVSNTNMHLRAAVGKSARVLVPHPADYRWMTTGRSPWFPDFQVYRQSADGGWGGAFASLSSDLSVADG